MRSANCSSVSPVIDSMSAVASNPPPRVLPAQHVRQTLQHVDADGPAGSGTVARHGVVAIGPFGFMRDRHQPGRRAVGNMVETLLQRPERKAQTRRRGLEQKRHEDRELTEAHAVLAQKPPSVLIQCLDVIGDLGARHDAVALDQPERDAARKSRDRLVAGQTQKRLELGGDPAVDEMLQPALDLEDDLGARVLFHEGLGRGFHRLGARHQPPDRLRAPEEATLLGHLEGGVGRVVEPVRPQVELRPERRHRSLPQRLGLIRACRLVLPEPEPVDPAQNLTLDGYLTAFCHLGHKALLLLQPAQKHTGAPVDKSLGQRAMQRIRQAVFYGTGGAAPMAFVLDPAGALRHVGPCADICQPLGQRVYVALRPVDPPHLPRQPVVGHARPVAEKTEDPAQQIGNVRHG